MTLCTEAQFLADVDRHKLVVLRDEGVYRHLRIARPGSGNQHFELITWPGHLCYTGDMGTYVFERTLDMFDFFRSDGGRINPRYWSEKCVSADKSDGVLEFDPDAFRAAVHERRVDLVRAARDSLNKEQRRELWDRVDEEVIRRIDEYRLQSGDVPHHLAYEFNYIKGSVLRDDYQVFRLPLDEFPRCEQFSQRYLWCCYALVWAIKQYDAKAVKPAREAA